MILSGTSRGVAVIMLRCIQVEPRAITYTYLAGTMDKQAVKSCPKCGSPMGIRLGELVCQACGYFMAIDAPDVHAGGAGKARGKVAAAPVFKAGRRGIAVYDDSHIQAGWRRFEKWALIVLLFMFVPLGNYLLNPAYRLESMEVYSFKSLFFAGLFFAAFVALALFIDWRGFKLLVLSLVCLAIVMNLWQIHHVSQLKTQLILYKQLADEILLVWLAILLYRETARTR